ncbi:tachykinin-4 [Panthera tigris]|uniref:tachykinin-4 n=1 Tax=Panthera tigris TaxID=9694 RepID=UPI001C6F67BC|nr:tachykinin-4 [Panthera tigris]
MQKHREPCEERNRQNFSYLLPLVGTVLGKECARAACLHGARVMTLPLFRLPSRSRLQPLTMNSLLPQDGVVPHIQLTLQEVKRGKTSQFFGLMGKRVEEIPPIQPERRTAPPPGHPPAGTKSVGPPGQGRTL